MHKPLHIILLLLFPLVAFAQNWRLFPPNTTSYYMLPNGEIPLALRVDSITTSGPNLLWHIPPIMARDRFVAGNNCLYRQVNSPFGFEITETPQGDYTWVTGCGIAVTMKTHPTAPWRVLESPMDVYIDSVVAVPLGYSTAIVLWQPDSVLGLQLQFWRNGSASNFSSQISKNYGWLNPVAFFEFIDVSTGDSCDIHYPEANLHSIEGVTGPVHDIPKEDFFTMQAGDTIQIERYYFFDFNNHEEQEYLQEAYLSRVQGTNDTLTFTIHRRQLIFSNIFGMTYVDDTVTRVLPLGDAKYRRLDRKWGEIVPAEKDASAWVNKWGYHTGFDRIQKPLNLEDYLNPADTNCFIQNYGITKLHDDFYWQGLGGPYFDGNGQDYQHHRLPVYFRLNGVAQGTPFDIDKILGQDKAVSGLKWEVYPNPAESVLRIRLQAKDAAASNCTWKLSNLQGQTVMVGHLDESGFTEIAVSHLPKGLYLMQLESQAGTQTRKVVLR